ncbi:MAG TPA: radical SAM protein, partial [Geodermatophilus sp.]|nr:radical SAM protein [Geodermatophilus sp.]
MGTSDGALGTPPLPHHLQLEVTSACNLSCAMCLVSYRPAVNRAEGAMPFELFRRLVDGTPGLTRLTLQGLGEPLLQPHLPEMVRYAKERGIEVGFNSNAMLLSRERADRFVALGLDWLHVSLDGATARTYEGIRSGGNFERVARNLRGLRDAKRAAGTDKPWVRVVFVAMRRNVHELPDLVRLLGEWEVNELHVQGLSHTFDDTDPAGAYAGIREFARSETLEHAPPDEVADVFARARAQAERSGVALRLPAPDAAPPVREPGRPGCTWPWDAAYVTASGTVQPCCMVMGDDRVSMGNLADADLAEIWTGEAYRQFRSALLGDTPPAVCAGCSLYRATF